MPLLVAREFAPGRIERRVFVQAGEHIHDSARLRRRVEHAVGREQRQARRARPVDQKFVLRLLARDEVTLDFHVEEVRAEEGGELRSGGGGGRGAVLPPGAPHRAFLVARQRHQSLGVFRQLAPADGALALGRPQVGRREQGAQAAIARLRRDQHRHDAAVLHGQFAADERAPARFPGRHVQPHRAVDAVAVAERERGQLQPAGLGRQRLRQRPAAQEGKRAAGMEFDVGHVSQSQDQGGARYP